MIKKLNGLCQIFLKSFAYFLFMIETFEAACIIFGRSPRKVDGPNPGEKYDDYWPEVISLLNDTHFIKTIQNFKPESLDKITIEKLKKYSTTGKALRVKKKDAAEQSFLAVAAFYGWICAVFDYWFVYQIFTKENCR